MTETEAWTREQRDALVKAYADAFVASNTVSRQIDQGVEKAEPGAMLLLNRAVTHELWKASDAYLAGLPRVTMARCPYNDTLSRVSFDPLGLDGPFWARQAPVRPRSEPEAGEHFIGITGAIRLEGEIETAPFLVAPGPAAPFVIPRMFEDQEVLAVLNRGRVGRHIAYAVSYFAAQPDTASRRPRLWGAKFKLQPEPDDPDDLGTDHVDDYDFNLRAWLEAGRLAWVAPGDRDCELRYGARDCPYLELPGSRELQYLQDGEVWS